MMRSGRNFDCARKTPLLKLRRVRDGGGRNFFRVETFVGKLSLPFEVPGRVAKDEKGLAPKQFDKLKFVGHSYFARLDLLHSTRP